MSGAYRDHSPEVGAMMQFFFSFDIWLDNKEPSTIQKALFVLVHLPYPAVPFEWRVKNCKKKKRKFSSVCEIEISLVIFCCSF